MRTTRRAFITSAAAAGAGISVWGGLHLAGCDGLREYDIRRFGARGDGRADDTTAFQRAAAALRRSGGGRLVIPAGSYLVGRQQLARHASAAFAYRGEDIMRIEGCQHRVEIIGDGAVLRTNGGLRFGSFDPVTGDPYQPPVLPFIDSNHRADVYLGALQLHNNQDVLVEGLELDGNSGNLTLGGQYGDSGYQIAHDGIVAYANRRLHIRDCRMHHHGRDGIILGHVGYNGGGGGDVRLERVTCDHNGRQGLSWVGGRRLRAQDCRFNHTGYSSIPVSNPGAGVDIEPEDAICRDAAFTRCEFVGNRGFGLIANVGDTRGVLCKDCTFWAPPPSRGGGLPRALWPNRPEMHFVDCRIYGSVVQTFGSPHPHEACRFVSCRFEDRQLAPGPAFSGVALIESGGENVLYETCEVVAYATRSFAFEPRNGQAGPHLRGCRVTHGYKGLASGGYQASLYAASLEHTHFAEDALSGPYYIVAEKAEVGPGVVVDGPHVRWGTVNGEIGGVRTTGRVAPR